MTEKLQQELNEVRKEVNSLGIRLTLAEAWVGFLHFAYDALLSHGVNYRTLREYQEDDTLDTARKLPLSQARQKIVAYLLRLKSGINAAARRKALKVIPNDKDT